jgi:hypothetical protein
MKYKVTFRKRFTPEGEPADDPKSLVSPADGVVEDSEFIEILEPAGLGVAEDLNEGTGSRESNDNGFLGLGREDEFRAALAESRVVLDFEEIPDESLTT